jgi:hypothetical protein
MYDPFLYTLPLGKDSYFGAAEYPGMLRKRAKEFTYLHDSIRISVSMICSKIHAECSWGGCCGVAHMCVCACITIPGPLLAGVGI